MDGLVDREAAAKPVDRDVDASPVASLTACATCSGERPRAWNVTTPYPARSSPSHSGCRAAAIYSAGTLAAAADGFFARTLIGSSRADRGRPRGEKCPWQSPETRIANAI